MIQQPLVTVAIPVFNGEERISHAILSACRQTYSNLEILISDNCSTDNTENICASFKATDLRIKYYRQKQNIGSIENFHWLLSQATGDYFVLLSDDDQISTYFIQEALDILDANQGIGTVFCHVEVLDYTSNTTVKKIQTSSMHSNSKFNRYIGRLLNMENGSHVLFGLHRTSMLRKYSLQRFDFYDVDLLLWLTLKSQIEIIPKFFFIAGTKGSRIPYSIEGKHMKVGQLLRRQLVLLQEELPLWRAAVAFGMLSALFIGATIRLNTIIGKSPQSLRQNEPNIL